MEEIDALIRVVDEAKERGENEREIIKLLIGRGVPSARAYAMLRGIDQGLHSGRMDVLTRKRSSVRIRLGVDEVFDAAFHEGRRKEGGLLLSVWERVSWKARLALAAATALALALAFYR